MVDPRFYISHYSDRPMIEMYNNSTFAYFQNYYFDKAASVLEWELPDNWDIDYFKICLYWFGYIAIINSPKYGIIPQRCTIDGFDIWRKPAFATVSNEFINNRYKIGKDCLILKLRPNFRSILDIVDFYAARATRAAMALDINLENAVTAPVIGAESKAQAETIKKAYDKVQSGTMAIIDSSDGNKLANGKGFSTFMPDMKNYFISKELLEIIKEINILFDTEIGIPHANMTKKERLVVDEVNTNKVETYSQLNLWLDSLKECLKSINKMFNLNIKVKVREFAGEEVNINANDNIVE